MRSVGQIHSWPLHYATADDEWNAVCGKPVGEAFITEPGQKAKPGFKVCTECKTACDKA